MILVTGASGLLGSTLLTRAQELGRAVIGVARNSHGIGETNTRSLDLTDRISVGNFMMNLHPSIVIHCAAATDVDWCEDHPEKAHEINTSISADLARLACQAGSRFVQISTDSVFDGRTGDYCETSAPNPVNVYAKTKWEAELEVSRLHPSPLILRVNFYGPSIQKKHKLAGWILDQVGSGKSVPGFTDVFFCPIFVQDVASVILEMLDHELTGLYHVVGSEKISKYEFAVRLAERFGLDSQLVVPALSAQAKLRAARPLDTSLKTEKVARTLGHAMPDLESGLHRFKRFYDSGRREEATELCAGGAE